MTLRRRCRFATSLLGASGILLVALAGVAVSGCKVKDPPPITKAWSDNFDRKSIGQNYRPTDREAYAIVDGALHAKGARNHPMWLRKKLPRNVVIELDVWSESEAGDIKVEIFGDGESFDPNGGGYTASGYVLIMGGWNNTKSIIARQNEHGDDLAERRGPAVVRGQHYHWKIVRDGKTITWFVDDMDTPFLTWQDETPLYGSDNAYFGVNNWESSTFFDNLHIAPL